MPIIVLLLVLALVAAFEALAATFVLVALVVGLVLYAAWEFVVPDPAKEGVGVVWRHPAARVGRVAGVWLGFVIGFSWLVSRKDGVADVAGWWLLQWENGAVAPAAIVCVGATALTFKVFLD